MVAIVDVTLGFIVGVVATTVAFELGIKKFLPKPQDSDWRTKWSLNDVGSRPSVVAEKITGVDLPSGARVVVRSEDRSLDDVPDDVEVRVHPEVRGNYVVGSSRALIFNSVIHPQAAAVHTVNDYMVDKLNRQFDRLWYGEEDGREEETIVDDEVSARGVVVDVEPIEDGRFMAKLSSQGKMLPVTVANAADLEGQQVRVRGQVVYQDGQRVLQASQVERTGGPAP